MRGQRPPGARIEGGGRAGPIRGGRLISGGQLASFNPPPLLPLLLLVLHDGRPPGTPTFHRRQPATRSPQPAARNLQPAIISPPTAGNPHSGPYGNSVLDSSAVLIRRRASPSGVLCYPSSPSHSSVNEPPAESFHHCNPTLPHHGRSVLIALWPGGTGFAPFQKCPRRASRDSAITWDRHLKVNEKPSVCFPSKRGLRLTDGARLAGLGPPPFPSMTVCLCSPSSIPSSPPSPDPSYPACKSHTQPSRPQIIVIRISNSPPRRIWDRPHHVTASSPLAAALVHEPAASSTDPPPQFSILRSDMTASPILPTSHS